MRLLTSLGLLALAPAVLAQGFAETQLRVGQAALSAGRPQEAADDLRIAAFGLLDRPAMLCEALETLAVAQDKAGQKAPADATLARLVEISRAFPACREARLEPGLRADFESLARKKLSPALADQILASPPSPTAAPTAAPAPTALPAATVRPTAAPTATRVPIAPTVTSVAVPTPTPLRFPLRRPPQRRRRRLPGPNPRPPRPRMTSIASRSSR